MRSRAAEVSTQRRAAAIQRAVRPNSVQYKSGLWIRQFQKVTERPMREIFKKGIVSSIKAEGVNVFLTVIFRAAGLGDCPRVSEKAQQEQAYYQQPGILFARWLALTQASLDQVNHNPLLEIDVRTINLAVGSSNLISEDKRIRDFIRLQTVACWSAVNPKAANSLLKEPLK